MSFTRTTNYRGYQITTKVQPTYRPIAGFVGHVSVASDGVQGATDTTEVMQNFIFAETTATNLGHEMVDVILGPLESNQKA